MQRSGDRALQAEGTSVQKSPEGSLLLWSRSSRKISSTKREREAGARPEVPVGHFHPSGCHSALNGNVNCQNHTWVTKNSGHGLVIQLPWRVEARRLLWRAFW